MKSRITFVRPQDTGLEAENIEISSNAVQIRSLEGAREERLTVGLQELPQEIARVLQKCHQLHLRWRSKRPFPSIAPFLSSLSPGLHIFLIPQSDRSADFLHPLLQEVFGSNIQCAVTPDTFVSIPASLSRFDSPSALHCYELVPSLKDFILYIAQRICPEANTHCLRRADHLQEVDYLDIDYDAISRSLTLTSFHHAALASRSWSEELTPYNNSAKTEVGILSAQKATIPGELALEGFLLVLGEDRNPSMPVSVLCGVHLTVPSRAPTRFSFPSRHHAVEPTSSGSTFTTTFPPPSGLHPTLRLAFSSSSVSPQPPACVLHTYLTLPSSVFIDKYQLSSPNFLASRNLGGIRALAGETDLEAPDWVIAKWGSALLLELAPPPPRHPGASLKSGSPWRVDIPLHMRYLPPIAGGSSTVDVPWPVVFWACPAEEGTKMAVNPFDRVNLGYESWFGPRTMFYHLQPRPAAEGASLAERVEVPVMDLERATSVEAGTVGIVMLGALWVVWKSLRVLLKDWRAEQAPIEKEKAQ